MKTYINAEMEVVLIQNDIIATSTFLSVGSEQQDGVSGDTQQRRSIWN